MKQLFIVTLCLCGLAACNSIGIQKANQNHNSTGEVMSVSKVKSGTTQNTPQTMSGKSTTDTSATSTGNTSTTSTGTEAIVQSGSYVSVYYTLRVGSPDTKIEQTNSETVAKNNNIYATGGVYQPLPVLIGANQVVPGFEEGLMGMKIGDKKSIVVPPEKGYGTGARISTIPKQRIAPEFNFTQDKRVIDDTLTNTILYSSTEFLGLDPKIQETVKSAEVGKELSLGNVKSKVKAKTKTGITLEFDNVQSPFYGKKKTVGTKVELPQANFTIKSFTDTGVIITVVDKRSPFYGKDFKEGASVQTGQGKIIIKKIEGDKVTIAEEHPFMGKTLYFDLEIADVK